MEVTGQGRRHKLHASADLVGYYAVTHCKIIYRPTRSIHVTTSSWVLLPSCLAGTCVRGCTLSGGVRGTQGGVYVWECVRRFVTYI